MQCARGHDKRTRTALVKARVGTGGVLTTTVEMPRTFRVRLDDTHQLEYFPAIYLSRDNTTVCEKCTPNNDGELPKCSQRTKLWMMQQAM